MSTASAVDSRANGGSNSPDLPQRPTEAERRLSGLMQKSLRRFSLTAQPHESSEKADERLALEKRDIYNLTSVPVPKFAYKWKFLSDHLPIGFKVDGRKFLSWNLLNNCHMHWVTDKDSQGLNGSEITELNKNVPGKPGLTQRDLKVIEEIISMLEHPEQKAGVFCLQECSTPVIQELRRQLEEDHPNFELIAPFTRFFNDHLAMIIHKDFFEYQSRQSSLNEYIYSRSSKTVMNVVLKDIHSGRMIRVLNAHIPGAPEGSARFEFAKRLVKYNKPLDDIPLVLAMGDLNFDPGQIDEALTKAQEELDSWEKTLRRHSLYRTNVGADHEHPGELQAKAIDHLITTDLYQGKSVEVKRLPFDQMYQEKRQTERIRAILTLFLQEQSD